MVNYQRVTSNDELLEILALQRENLREELSLNEKQKEGFVTLQHDFEILKRMNDHCAHCIAKYNGKVVGYALSMLQDFKKDIPLLIPMFKEIDEIINAQKRSKNYIVMGQICIDKSMRGKGVFRGLYAYMEKEFSTTFDAIITEVDTNNIRSSNAHKAVGFQLLKKYTANNQLWEIILLEI